MRLLRPAMLIALLAQPAAAQTSHDAQLWLNATAMGSIRGDLVYFAEVQPRIGDDAAELKAFIARPAIGLRVDPTLTLYQGYARVNQPDPQGPDRFEDRSFQQATWIVRATPNVEIQSRTRVEQRWLSTGRDTGWRLRQMIRYERPFSPGQGGAAFLAHVEGFVALNDTDWGARGGFDQIRGFVGVELPFTGRSTLELGYLNQYVDQPGPTAQMNHVASVTLFFRH